MSPPQTRPAPSPSVLPTHVVAELQARGVRRDPAAKLPTIPGYDVLELIGRGGMSSIFLARQRNPSRLVAIKMINPPHSQNEHFRRRFLREAYSMTALRHDNVVQIHEIGESDGMLYLALEYVAGGSLAERIRQNRPTPHEAAEIMRQLAEAVRAAHERQIIHRDLKPANVLCVEGPEPDEPRKLSARRSGAGRPVAVKVTDFGLARIATESSEETRPGFPIGTPCFMSPEQAAGHTDEVGAASDVYGLGGILYEMLTGRPPFLGATARETIAMVCRQMPTAPRQIDARVPKDLERICLKCLQKDPADRYAGAGELLADLERYLHGQAVIARLPGAVRKWLGYCRRRPGRTLAVLGLATALVAGTGYVFWNLGAQRGQLPAGGEQAQTPGERPADDEAAALLARVRQDPKAPDLAHELAGLGEERVARLAGDHPDDYAAQYAAGDGYLVLGRAEKALPLFARAHQLAEEQFKRGGGGFDALARAADAAERHGDVQRLLKDDAAAGADYARTQELRDSLYQDEPGRLRTMQLADFCGKHAEFRDLTGNRPLAKLLLHQRLDTLARRHRDTKDLGPVLRDTYERLADLHRRLGEKDAANEYARKAMEFAGDSPR